eukprot:SAG31_NODE_21408_length_550_cov_1.226164_1_plen_54_part_10
MRRDRQAEVGQSTDKAARRRQRFADEAAGVSGQLKRRRYETPQYKLRFLLLLNH